jgi:predicted RNA binding protein YcfA (HicA-like mRNA interferase family)
MPCLPARRCQQVIGALKKAGFIRDRQKGSHVVMRHPQTNALTVIPVHAGKTLKRPLLRSFLQDANLSEAEFLSFYKAFAYKGF